jgi:uncharacterized protein (TIGR00255 family)
MTGFARHIGESPVGTLTVELRAVNHRYLDVQFRLPEELRGKEVELRQQVSEVLKRGKVECSVHFRRATGSTDDMSVDSELVRQIGAGIAEVSSLLPDAGSVDPIDVLRWPGVVLEPNVDAEPVYIEARVVLGGALDALSEMRRNEGERIATMLESRCRDIRKIGASVRARLPDVLAAVRQRQQDRLDKLEVSADPARLETELALVAQKLDVDEELDRLESHVVEILEVIGRDEPVGRRLDFLMQELNREANTLGSKSADTETTRAAVELKVLIEQLREQVQNVE